MEKTTVMGKSADIFIFTSLYNRISSFRKKFFSSKSNFFPLKSKPNSKTTRGVQWSKQAVKNRLPFEKLRRPIPRTLGWLNGKQSWLLFSGLGHDDLDFFFVLCLAVICDTFYVTSLWSLQFDAFQMRVHSIVLNRTKKNCISISGHSQSAYEKKVYIYL